MLSEFSGILLVLSLAMTLFYLVEKNLRKAAEQKCKEWERLAQRFTQERPNL